MLHYPAEHVLDYTKELDDDETADEMTVTPEIEVQFYFTPTDSEEEYNAIISILLSNQTSPSSNHELAAALNDLISQALFSDDEDSSSSESFFSGSNYDPIYKDYENRDLKVDDEHIEDSSMRMGYYFYKGSMTKPSCDESVYWYVFREVLPVTNETLTSLQSLVEAVYGSSEDGSVSQNARSVVGDDEDRDVRLEGCNPLYAVF